MSPTRSSYDGKAAQIHTDAAEGGSQAEGIQAAKSAIEAAGGTVEVFDYPDTEHAFFNDDRPEVYDAQAASDAWDRTVAFFRTRLG
jgi:carboxymethylenebutenolidase